MIAYLAVVTLAGLLDLLPLRLALALGRGLGTICFHVVRLRRRVVLANLRHTVADGLPEREVRRMGADVYRQFAMTLVEVLRSSASGARGLERQVEFPSLDRFVELREEKSPLILIQGHAGNFDLTAYAFAARGFPHHTVMKAIGNDRLNTMIVRAREQHGVSVHLKGPESYQEILAVLGDGGWVGLLPDQNAKERGVSVNFLGKPASFFKGPALLQIATGAPICVAVDERIADDRTRHRVHFRFIEPRVSSGDKDADVAAIMQSVADAMSERIRRNPTQYFWFHRLWGKKIGVPVPAPAA